MTARHLIADLKLARVRLEVDGAGLIWTAEADDPPEHLLAALAVLHTGVRAVLTGRRWFGFDPKTCRPCGPKPAESRGLLAYGALDPAAKLPACVTMLSVEGDATWDRIAPTARIDLPFLFVQTAAEPPAPTAWAGLRKAVSS